MAQHHHAAHATAEDEYASTPPGAGYEHTDAHVWVIVRFAIWLAISAAIIHVAMWGLFYVLVDRYTPSQAAEFPMKVDSGLRLPVEPRLQRFPANEMYDFRLRENAILTGYNWVDRNAGTVQIPIDQAMRLVVERGLPARQQAEPAQEAGQGQLRPAPPIDTPATLMPADSSSGRTLERRRQ